MPYVTTAGRVVTRSGWDEETRLYLSVPMDYQSGIIANPSSDQIRQALTVALGPWLGYQFTDPASAGGMVAAVFTAIVRPVLDIAPAFMFDAAQYGAGKSKAACALGALVEGQRPGVTPFSAASNDDELRKRLMAGAIAGERFHCVDNVSKRLDSSVLASVLTTGRITDRKLGVSENVNARIKALMTLTGANTALSAELLRRTVHIRIDGGLRPTEAVFEWCPVNRALAERRAIADAVCTVLSGYFAAGAPTVVKGDAGGFADWASLCRGPVNWLIESGLADCLPWTLADPASSMLADASQTDPELEALADMLRTLFILSEGERFVSGDAVNWVAQGENHPDEASGELRSAVLELVGKVALTSRSLGQVLANRRDRPVGGFKLLMQVIPDGKKRIWRVVQT